MSKPDGDVTTVKERLYQGMLRWATLYLMGACRPVLAQPCVAAVGFTDVSRTLLPGALASELVLAHKPPLGS